MNASTFFFSFLECHKYGFLHASFGEILELLDGG